MPLRHRFLEPIHNVKEGANPQSAAEAAKIWSSSLEISAPLAARAAAVVGGASRDRTDDLKLAKLALSQLSYGPNCWDNSQKSSEVRIEFSSPGQVLNERTGGPGTTRTSDLTLIRGAL